MSKYVAQLAFQLKAFGMPTPKYELRFAPPRRFRFDVAYPEVKLAVEVDGATWARGRHTRGAGHESDCIKRNLAIEEGWKVLTYPARLIESGEAVKQVMRVYRQLSGGSYEAEDCIDALCVHNSRGCPCGTYPPKKRVSNVRASRLR